MCVTLCTDLVLVCVNKNKTFSADQYFDPNKGTLLKQLTLIVLMLLVAYRQSKLFKLVVWFNSCTTMEPLVQTTMTTKMSRTFAVFWTGSNVLVSPNLVVHFSGMECREYKAGMLTQAVAKLLVCEPMSVKVHFANPGGPELSRILRAYNQQTYEAKFVEFVKAWSNVEQHDPATAIKVYVTQHNQVDLALNTLRGTYYWQTPLTFASMGATLRADWRVALQAVSRRPCCIMNVDEKLLSNRQFLLAALSANRGVVFKLRDKTIPKDKQAVFAAALRLLNLDNDNATPPTITV